MTLAILLEGGVLFNHKGFLLGIVGIWLAMILASFQAVTYSLLRGVEVTPECRGCVQRHDRSNDATIMVSSVTRIPAPPTTLFGVGRSIVSTELRMHS
jgi:hypothetical protein